MDFLLTLLQKAILSLMGTYPWFATLIFVVGVLRLVVKPIMTAIDGITVATPTTADDTLWASIKTSSWFKGFLWILDWFGSIKISKK